jgi:hypothetical protein
VICARSREAHVPADLAFRGGLGFGRPACSARLRESVGQHGWPGPRLVGEAGAHAAWLLVQDAPPELQEECLPLLQDAVARGDASPADLTYLMDRVLMYRGEPQIYGTQYQVRDGVLELWPVRDPLRSGPVAGATAWLAGWALAVCLA